MIATAVIATAMASAAATAGGNRSGQTAAGTVTAATTSPATRTAAKGMRDGLIRIIGERCAVGGTDGRPLSEAPSLEVFATMATLPPRAQGSARVKWAPCR